jgi:hypothetical protein
MLPMHGTVTERAALFQRVSFVAEVTKQLKSLSGWTKSHRIPDQANDRAQEFVASISTSELKQDLDSIYDSLKQAFGFKRRDLSVAEPADGTGTITTPHFSYSVSVALNPADTAEVIWTKTVDNIQSPGEVVSEAFAEVFDNVFRTLQFSLPTAVDIDDFIDALEAAEIANLELTYDRDTTYCELRFDETPGAVRVTADTLSIVQKHPVKISTLIQSLQAIQSLVHQHNVPLVWSAAKN